MKATIVMRLQGQSGSIASYQQVDEQEPSGDVAALRMLTLTLVDGVTAPPYLTLTVEPTADATAEPIHEAFQQALAENDARAAKAAEAAVPQPLTLADLVAQGATLADLKALVG